MSEVPRRRALLAAASGIAALAGCAGSESASNSALTRQRPVEEYELETARDERGSALFAEGETLPSPSADGPARQHRRAHRVLVADDEAAALTFAETEPGEALRSFCDATDFDAASVYLIAMPVRACREILLESVTVDRDELAEGDLHPNADFCEAYRPADVECGPDEIHTAGFAIRMPVAASHSTGSGRGMSGSCRRGDPPAVFNSSAASDAGGDGS
ncbi:hypothetical protein ABNG02_05305 [Halorubrum ejinorense]|uniref:Uncharacterized protein n=1 Tax=Halorubrum ejinorense TaxID=425309 RepID=A0AAV3SS97_9EURY